MDPLSLRRRIARVPGIPSDQRHGRIGLQQQPQPGDASSAKDKLFGDLPTNDLELRAPQAPILPRQAVSTTVESIFNIIVENSVGATVAEATLPALPSTGAVLTFPFGTVTVPSLRIQGGSVVPVSASPYPTRSAPRSTAATPTSRPTRSHRPSQPVSSISGSSNGTSTSTSRPHSSNIPLTTTPTNSSSTTQKSTSTTPTTLQTTTHSSLHSTSNFGIMATPTIGSHGAGSSTGPGSAASSTAAAAAAPASQVNTPTVVGGVVGGVAGFAVFLALIMVLVRWRKHHFDGTRELRSNPDMDQRPDTGRSDTAMAEAPSLPWGATGAAGAAGAMAAAGAGAVGAYAGATRENPFADPPSPPPQRGFQKLGGRKLESVLVSGGDGYGEPAQRRGGQNVTSTADSSFYRDSGGNYGGPASNTSSVYQPPRELDATPMGATMGAAVAPSVPPVPERRNPGPFRSSPDGESSSPSPPPDLSTSPPDVVLMRPGPARQAVHTPAYNTPPQSPTHRLRTDAIGRSHPSFDGSRGSRGSKFAEDLG